MRLLELPKSPLPMEPRLVSVPSLNPPKYAILSHTWGPPDDEVLFNDFSPGLQESAKAKKAYAKVLFACHEAEIRGFNYCWIDTCCIDKSSSTELQEAINSMFTWYQNAERCYVYLSDVDAPTISLPYRRKSARRFWRRPAGSHEDGRCKSSSRLSTRHFSTGAGNG